MTQTPRDWQKDMALVQNTIKHDAFPAWTEPMLYWLQEAKERGEGEQRLKAAVEAVIWTKGLESLVLKAHLQNILTDLYPDTPAPKEGTPYASLD